MSPDKQRIAIAEACGWKFETGEKYMDGGNFSGIDYKSVKPPHGLTYTISHKAAILSTPDYLNDLNAIHEALKTQPIRIQQKYIPVLRNLCAVKGSWPEEATAAQRAEAFLRTLGKWEEGK